MRFLAISLAGVVGFLAPLLYETVSTDFWAIACVGAVLALLTNGAIHIALERMREQRHRLEFLISATAKLDTTLDPQQALRRIAATLCRAGRAVGDRPRRRDRGDHDGRGGLDPELAGDVERMHGSHPPDLRPHSPIALALSTRRPCVVRLGRETDEAASATPADREADPRRASARWRRSRWSPAGACSGRSPSCVRAVSVAAT